MIQFLRKSTDTLAELLALYFAAVLLAAWAFAYFEARGFGEAVYWAFTTALTVGYGDISPASAGGRIVAVLLMHVVPLGIAPILIVRLTHHMIENRDAFTDEEQREIIARLRRLDPTDLPTGEG